MYLPCDTCKFKKEIKRGFRTFVGCIDEKKEKDNFIEDDYTYNHSCKAYENLMTKNEKGDL